MVALLSKVTIIPTSASVSAQFWNHILLLMVCRVNYIHVFYNKLFESFWEAENLETENKKYYKMVTKPDIRL